MSSYEQIPRRVLTHTLFLRASLGSFRLARFQQVMGRGTRVSFACFTLITIYNIFVTIQPLLCHLGISHMRLNVHLSVANCKVLLRCGS